VSDLAVAEATAADAAAIVDVIHRSFSARPLLEPPSMALAETEQSVTATLAAAGGLLCRVDGQPAGVILFGTEPGVLKLRRVSAVPELQSRGVASAMVGVAEEIAGARGLDDVVLEARLELPETVEFWYRRGYREVSRDGTRLVYGKALAVSLSASDSEEMRAIGREIGRLAEPGDLLVLGGELGAGKTTLVQGIGVGLEVRGPVTSPTFVISRIHPSMFGGPALVHVDAYRLRSIDEVDDLDLEAYLETAVTVVEWGEGIAEGLADNRLLIRIGRPRVDGDLVKEPASRRGTLDPPTEDTQTRRIAVIPVGPSWLGRRLRSRLQK
jgi:tRNA threonylcarbamoyladenosine biosynthesis protein TsaE